MPEPTAKAAATGLVAAGLTMLAALGLGGPLTMLAAATVSAALAAARGWAEREAEKLGSITLERILPRGLAEGAEARVALRVRYPRGDPPSYIEIADGAPARARGEGTRLRLRPPARGEAGALYTIRPAPGLLEWREALITTGDPLGLFTASRRVRLPGAVSVKPLGLHELPGPGRPLGLGEPIAARARGASPEFYQLREYQPGDDVRLISWTATARAGTPMVREGVVEEQLNIALMADQSLPAWAGTPGESSADWIMRAALSLVAAAAASGGRAWLYILRGESWEEWPALRGREAVDTARERLSQGGPSASQLPSAGQRLAERLLEEPPPGTAKILLLGPGFGARMLRAAAESSQRPPAGAAAVYVASTGGGEDDELSRRLTRREHAAASRLLAPLGVTVLYADSPGALGWAASRLIRAARGWRG